ncbi:helix-turn-helix domain-containing protein [Pseudonocardia sp. CA-107938]|uniref:helix-turn-helix domain-containing protein n=1 Tax=Pseudonocardia sp. CA-107938 TaxID=3240021 RepID=UPI003D89EA9A
MPRRADQVALAARLRAADASAASIGLALRETYGINARLAQRLARGWTQEETAAEWSRRWPDDPKTFKNVSYWENWPGPTGHAPSLAVLDRLAQLYECDVADLVADWGNHAPARPTDDPVESETWAWQVEHLALPELTRSVADWAERFPERRRREFLLTLSTAASIAAASDHLEGSRTRTARPRGDAQELAGRWISRYRYPSTSRKAEFSGQHEIDLVAREGRLVGRSLPQDGGSVLDLELTVEGMLASGSWVERTSPTGHYRAATFHGLIQLVVDPTARVMQGRWLGISRRYTIKSGEWELERLAQASP